MAKPDARTLWPAAWSLARDFLGSRASRRSAVCLLAACGACSPCSMGAPPKGPSQYAALPPVALAEQAAFEAAPGLFRIEAPCGAEESPEENGLDDDCNGLIDERTPAYNSGTAEPTTHNSVVSVVIAYPRAASGTARIEIDTSASPEDTPSQTDSAGPTVQVRRLDLPALPKGHYPLRLSWQAADPGAPELSLSVSLATAGASQTYLVRLAAGESRTLGEIVFN